MSNDRLEQATKYIKNKGFGWIKVELEANLNRNSEDSDREYCEYCDQGYIECEHDTQCEDCDGQGRFEFEGLPGHDPAQPIPASCSCQAPRLTASSQEQHYCVRCEDGHVDCDESHRCDECDGEGYQNGESNGLSDSYCEDMILNTISPEARKALVYGGFYYDSSVDSEYTFTLPIEQAGLIPEFMRAFKQLSDETGHFDTQDAGLHIAVLPESVYPCSKRHDQEKLENFKTEVSKLLPALYFLGTATPKTRRVFYRQPRISEEHYSAISILRGGFEYRVFDPCFDKPEAIFDYIGVIARTLKFYGRATVKNVYFKEFVFPDSLKSVNQIYQTNEQVSILDQGLRILRSRGKTVKQLKQERNFKFDPNREAKLEAKLQAKYQAWLSDQEIEIQTLVKSRLRDAIRLSERQRKLYPDAKLSHEALREVMADTKKRVQIDYPTPAVPYPVWKDRVIDRGTYKLTLPERSA